MGIGYLRLEISTGNEVLPVKDARVTIKNSSGQFLYDLMTNANGVTDVVELAAPDAEHTLDASDPGPYYSTCDVIIEARGYDILKIYGVQIFDGEESVLPATMIPVEHSARVLTIEKYIPENNLHKGEERFQESYIISDTLNEVIIPEYVIVHLGRPNATAKNVWVKFVDYLKNVASSEIYPTWPVASLEANIYCQITFILNRIYTEWYMSRGYPFHITNSTAYDQYFVEGRNIFQSVSDVVDRIFNIYIKRRGFKEPYFSQYCNGTTSTCPGLSQWGTVTLAEQGRTPMEILKHYYPNDIELIPCDNYSGVYESYPGFPLREGSSGTDVQKMQDYLNRIRTNYPLIPLISDPNGYFAADTKTAVRFFQRTFSIHDDGVIGKATWNKIVSIYTAVKRLAELDSEGQRIDVGTTPPTIVLRPGDRGENVVLLQFILDYISKFYSSIPPLIENSIFDNMTKESVVEFQREFGLTPDGIVGPGTWNKLYDVYLGIIENVELPQEAYKPYPGYVLRIGTNNEDVKVLQGYLNKISKHYPSIPKLTADGNFGSGTQASVIEFQRLFGLNPDGAVGRMTWDKVIEILKQIDEGNPDEVYPGTALRVGSRGDDVALIQRYLNKIREKNPSIPLVSTDGIFGSGTEAAVKEFQRLYALTSDGVVGKTTWDAIIKAYHDGSSGGNDEVYPGTALRVGSRGDDVALIQRYLNKIREKNPSIPLVSTDGIFGSGTEAAVKEFQRLYALTSDGVVGKTTWDAIIKAYHDGSSGGNDEVYPGTALRVGSRGDDVAFIQRYLNKIREKNPSIPLVSTDGIFGSGTEAAVKEFQRLYALTSDGVVGKTTWDAIIKAYHDGSSGGNDEVYPGTALRVGSRGDDVALIQRYLNKIREKNPSIPLVSTDGIFGSGTEAAVKEFQRLYALTSDGVVGKTTWDAIIKAYHDGSSGGNDEVYPGTALRVGSVGDDVALIQRYLNKIREKNPSIPLVSTDGIFGSGTEAAVKEFQRLYALTSDGVVGKTTWDAIIKAYHDGSSGGNDEVYPGTALRVGSVGDDVALIQRYLNKIREKNPSIPLVSTDGTFGSGTEKAVKEFQRLYALTSDGVVGKTTWDAIIKAYHDGGSGGNNENYPGTPLRLGSTGDSVTLIQKYLNKIREKNPSIPLTAADGVFSTNTERAVREFQRLFGITSDGMVGKTTWDAIIRVYHNGSVGDNDTYPGTALRSGSRGDSVALIQRYLNKISLSYVSIPKTPTDGIFGTATEASVKEFQRLFALTPDGIVGKTSWDTIVAVYHNVSSVSSDSFPGNVFKKGDSDKSIETIQRYLNKTGQVYGGIKKINENGVFDTNTEIAIKEFQKLFGLNQNGVLNNTTWDAIVRTYQNMSKNFQINDLNPIRNTDTNINKKK